MTHPLPQPTQDHPATRVSADPRGLRVAYLAGEYPRATDTFIQREVRELRELGVEIVTFSVRAPSNLESGGPELASERAKTVRLLPASPLRVLATHAVALVRNPWRYLRVAAFAMATRRSGLTGLIYQIFYFLEAGLLASEIRARGLKHIHNHSGKSSATVAMLAADLGGFTYSLTVHGPSEFHDPNEWQLAAKVGRARFVACISHFCRSQLMLFSAAAHWGKLAIVHCGIRPSDYDGELPSGDGTRLLYVGRLAPAKGVAVLLDAFALVLRSHPNVMLTILGDGPDRSALQGQAIAMGVSKSVRFLGYQSQDSVRLHLGEADIFVMSSFAEGVPVVLMEAMASGLPVVAPFLAGIPELVEDGVSGYLTPPGDPVSLSQRINTLVGDSSLRAAFGQKGRESVRRNYNLNTEVQRLRSLLENPRMEMFVNRQDTRDGGRSYCLITPCRDEAPYARRTLESVVKQRIRPALWVIVDDGSTDETGSILDEYAARYDFIRVIHRKDRGQRSVGPGVVDAFYAGYETIDIRSFDFVCKFDLDLDIPRDYFQNLMQRMEENLRIGTCSGKPYYPASSGRLRPETCGDEMSVGMIKFYRTECFLQIGGFVREVMWDGIDCHRCRMLGWIAVSWDDAELRFEHLRPMGSSHKGILSGRARHGYGQYFMGTGPVYILASAIFRMWDRPVILGSAAMAWGYFRSSLARKHRYARPQFRGFLRRYQLRCLLFGKGRATRLLDEKQAKTWRELAPARRMLKAGNAVNTLPVLDPARIPEASPPPVAVSRA